MITLRKSADRGHGHHGWLKTYHTFSFADYHDPKHMHFRHLRVMNEDWIDGGEGFGLHPHRDMEIVTYLVEGSLEHRDSLGNGAIMKPGDVQRMTAGTGIRHSETNPDPKAAIHLLQIWILPAKVGLTPGYEQKHFAAAEKQGRLRLLVSPDSRDNSLLIHQNVEIYASILSSGEKVEHSVSAGRHAWVQVITGKVIVNGVELEAGDGAAASKETKISVEAVSAAEFLLFDLE